MVNFIKCMGLIVLAVVVLVYLGVRIVNLGFKERLIKN